MGMTIENSIETLTSILDEATECDNSVCYVTSVDAEALKLAIKALKNYEAHPMSKKFKGMTNGEVVKATFPSAIIEKAEEGRFMQVIYSYFKTYYPIDWWNAPYKEVIDGNL